MPTVESVIVATNFKYSGVTGKVGETVVYFMAGASLRLDGHWEFALGKTFRIVYDGEPPYEPSAVVCNG